MPEPGEPEPVPDFEQDLKELLQTEVSDSVKECIEAWMELDPSLQGRVRLSFTLGPEGLEQADILDHEGFGGGALTCFGTALYEVEWPSPPDGTLTVTWPIVVTSGDTGEP